jgi:hypothetical protein
MNATGMKISLAPDIGWSVMLPKYWPPGRSRAFTATSISSVSPGATLQSGDVTSIVAPVGATTRAENVCGDPLTFRPKRVVEITPGMSIASMLGRLRSIQSSGLVPAATKSIAGTSNVIVGRTARSARIDPAPSSNGSAGVTPSSLVAVWSADVMRADLTCPGVQLGWIALTSAATPEAYGLDIDVPAMDWNN